MKTHNEIHVAGLRVEITTRGRSEQLQTLNTEPAACFRHLLSVLLNECVHSPGYLVITVERSSHLQRDASAVFAGVEPRTMRGKAKIRSVAQEETDETEKSQPPAALRLLRYLLCNAWRI